MVRSNVVAVVKEFRTAADYWSGMVEPDYLDCMNNPADLRAAFHAAISLFHMHDWVWKTHEAAVRAIFTFTDKIEATIKVHDNTSFANALEQQYSDCRYRRYWSQSRIRFDAF